jgi:hydroxymethylbilane synthase
MSFPDEPHVRPSDHATVQSRSNVWTEAVRVGTRGSPLALIQTRAFIEWLRGVCPALRPPGVFVQHVMQTTGDRVQHRSLADIGGKGLFAKEIHEALVGGRVDIGVHSLKDLETCLPPGVALGCVLQREDPRDALVVHWGAGRKSCSDAYDLLPSGSTVGSNSPRRQAQLLHGRPDLRITLLRGNVPTRLTRILQGEVSATFLAMAGLVRSGLLHVPGAMVLPLAPDRMVPAAGQGMIAVTVREDDTMLRGLLAQVENPDARAIAAAERALLVELNGSCRTPIGGHAQLLREGRLRLTGLVARADGSFLVKMSIDGPASDASALGAALGRELRVLSPPDIFL